MKLECWFLNSTPPHILKPWVKGATLPTEVTYLECLCREACASLQSCFCSLLALLTDNARIQTNLQEMQHLRVRVCGCAVCIQRKIEIASIWAHPQNWHDLTCACIQLGIWRSNWVGQHLHVHLKRSVRITDSCTCICHTKRSSICIWMSHIHAYTYIYTIQTKQTYIMTYIRIWMSHIHAYTYIHSIQTNIHTYIRSAQVRNLFWRTEHTQKKVGYILQIRTEVFVDGQQQNFFYEKRICNTTNARNCGSYSLTSGMCLKSYHAKYTALSYLVDCSFQNEWILCLYTTSVLCNFAPVAKHLGINFLSA